MNDAIISAARVLALIVFSVCAGSLPFLSYHQTFVDEVATIAH